MATIGRETLSRLIAQRCHIAQPLAARALREILWTVEQHFAPWLTMRFVSEHHAERFWKMVKRQRKAQVELKGFGRFELRYAKPITVDDAARGRRVRRGRGGLRVVFIPGRHLREAVSGQPDPAHRTPPGTPRRHLLGRP
jgi:nucleoid DNA-binding protein